MNCQCINQRSGTYCKSPALRASLDWFNKPMCARHAASGCLTRDNFLDEQKRKKTMEDTIQYVKETERTKYQEQQREKYQQVPLQPFSKRSQPFAEDVPPSRPQAQPDAPSSRPPAPSHEQAPPDIPPLHPDEVFGVNNREWEIANEVLLFWEQKWIEQQQQIAGWEASIRTQLAMKEQLKAFEVA